jgi:hypothetical protein
METITLLWMFILGINAWNIYAIGNSWVEARISGGWRSMAMWLGAAFTAASLSWNLLAIESYFAYAFEYLDLPTILFLYSLAYPLFFAGLGLGVFMTVFASWSRGYRRQIIEQHALTALDIPFFPAAPATAQPTHPTHGDGFGLSFDDDGLKFIVLVVIVSVALLGGVLLTIYGIRYFAEQSEANRYPAFG